MKRMMLIVLCVFFTSCAIHTVVSEGDRVGVITKLSHKMTCGQNWNWEGEMAMQGGTIAANQGQVDENFNRSAVGVWQFSILDNDPNVKRLVSDAKNALNSGHAVRVSYSQIADSGCESGSDYRVVQIADLSGAQS